MKIDMSAVLTDLDGKPIFEADAQGQPTTKPLTLRIACRGALLSPLRGDDALTGEQKANFFALALLVGQDAPELKIEQVATLKERIGKGYSPLIVGRCYELLDPPSGASG